MQISQVGFWTPCSVLDFRAHSRFKSYLLSIGEKVDRLLSYEEGDFIGGFIRVNAHHHCFSKVTNLKGRAKEFTISYPCESYDLNEVLDISDLKPEKIPLSQRIKLVFKVALVTIIFFPSILIKSAYRFLYLFPLKKMIHFNEKLNEIIQKYPDDLDLQLLKKSLFFEKNPYFSVNSENFNEIKEIILLIRKILKNDPQHTHAKKFFDRISHLFLTASFNENFTEFFDFYVQNFSDKISSFWLEKYGKIKSEQDREFFKFLWNSIAYIYRNEINDENVLYYFLFHGEQIINKSCDNLIDGVNRLINENKNRLFYLRKWRSTDIDKQEYGDSSLFAFKRLLKKHADDALSAQLVELSKKIELADDGFTQEFLERHLLSNFFGLDANTKINQTEYDLGGIHPFSYKQFLKIDESFDYLSQNLKMFDIKKVLEKLQKQHVVYESQLSHLNHILKNEAENHFHISTITVGDMSHAVSQVKYKNFLFLGNRGGGSDPYPGILVFKIDGQKFNPKNGKSLLLNKLSYFRYIKDLLRQDYFKGLNAKFLGYIPLPYQWHKNCPWKAFKMNIFSTLLITQTADLLEKGEKFGKIKEKVLPCLKLQKIVSHECRLQAFSHYLERHKRKVYSLGKDENIVEKIRGKAKKKGWDLVA